MNFKSLTINHSSSFRAFSFISQPLWWVVPFSLSLSFYIFAQSPCVLLFVDCNLNPFLKTFLLQLWRRRKYSGERWEVETNYNTMGNLRLCPKGEMGSYW